MDKYRTYLKQNDLLPRTISAYCYDVGLFLTRFDDATKLTPKDISDHLRRLSSGAKRKKRYLASITSYYTFLVEEGMMVINPASGVKRPRVRPSLPKYLTQFEVDVVRMACPDVVTKTIVDMFYFTGVRLEELRTCQLTSLNMDKMEIKVSGKGDKERYVPFPKSLIPLFNEYLLYRNSIRESEDSRNYLFIKPNGKQLNVNQLQYLFRKLSKNTGIKVRAHMLRHTFATHAIQRGMSRQAVKEILGHVSVSTTDWYIHLKADVRTDYDLAFK